MAAAARTDSFDATIGTLGPHILVSFAVHVVLLVGLPMVMHVLWRPATFVRPNTFQLVRVAPPSVAVAPPASAKPRSRLPEPTPSPAKKPAKTPQPQSSPKSRPQQETSPQEDLSELESLLGGISAPSVDYAVPSDFKYLWYLNAITRKVEQNWRPPLQDSTVYVEVTFTIFRNGGISDVTVTRSSGSPGLDNMAVRAIKIAAPFGELPVGYGESRLEITYRLRPTRR